MMDAEAHSCQKLWIELKYISILSFFFNVADASDQIAHEEMEKLCILLFNLEHS